MAGGSPPAKVRRCGSVLSDSVSGSGSIATSEDAHSRSMLSLEAFLARLRRTDSSMGQLSPHEAAVAQSFSDTLSCTTQGQQLAQLKAQESAAARQLQLLQESVACARAANERRRAQDTTAVEELRQLQIALQEKEVAAHKGAEEAIEATKAELSQEKQRLQAALGEAEHELTRARCGRDSFEKVLREVAAQQERALQDLQVAANEQMKEDDREKAEAEEDLNKARTVAEQKRLASDEHCRSMLLWIAQTVEKAKVSKRQQVHEMEKQAEEAAEGAARICVRIQANLGAAQAAADATERDFLAKAEAAKVATADAQRRGAIQVLQEKKQLDEKLNDLTTECEQQQIVASMLVKEAEAAAVLAASTKQRFEASKARTRLAREQAGSKRMHLMRTLQCMDARLQAVMCEARDKQAAAERKAEERIEEAYARAEAEEAAAAAAEREAQLMDQIATEAKVQSDCAIRFAKQTREAKVQAAEELAAKAVEAVADNMRLAGAGKESLLSCLLGGQSVAAPREAAEGESEAEILSAAVEDGCQSPSTPQPRPRARGPSSSVRHRAGEMERFAGELQPQGDSYGANIELRGFRTLLEQRRARAFAAGQAHHGMRVSHRRQGRL